MPTPTPPSSPPPSSPSSWRPFSHISADPSSPRSRSNSLSSPVVLDEHNLKIFKAYEEGKGSGLKGLENAEFSENVDAWKKAVEAHQPDLSILTDILKAYLTEAKELRCRKLCLFTEEAMVLLVRPKRKGDGIKIFFDPTSQQKAAKTETYPVVNQDLTKTILNSLYKQDFVSKFLGKTPGSGDNGHVEENPSGKISTNGPPPEPDCDYDYLDSDSGSASITSGSGSALGIIPNARIPESNGLTDSLDEERILFYNMTLADANKTSEEDAERKALLEQGRQSVQHRQLKPSFSLETFPQPGPLVQTFEQASNDPGYVKAPESGSPSSNPKTPPFLKAQPESGPTINAFLEKLQSQSAAENGKSFNQDVKDIALARLLGGRDELITILNREREELRELNTETMKSDSYSSGCKKEMQHKIREHKIIRDRIEGLMNDGATNPTLSEIIKDMADRNLKTVNQIRKDLSVIVKRHAAMDSRTEVKQLPNGSYDVSSVIGHFSTGHLPSKTTADPDDPLPTPKTPTNPSTL